MPRVGTPIKLASQIYQYRTSIRVVAKIRNSQKECRYPLGTELDVMRQWQLSTKADLLGDAPLPLMRTSIAADAPLYLKTLTGRRKKDDRALLQHWITCPFGKIPRCEITRTQIKGQLATWEEAKVAASTLNHRLRVLRKLYQELDGDEAENPTTTIHKRREPTPQPRGVPYDLIEALIAFMPNYGRAVRGGSRGPCLGRLRADVMAWTGLPPAQVMLLKRVHFNKGSATLTVQPRRKGKGTPAHTIPLLPQAVSALTAFFDAKAEGPFSTSAFYKQWIGAQRRLELELRKTNPAIALPHMRPYDIRHSFGSELFRRSKNLLAVRKLLLHAKVATSERYLEGAVDEAAQQAINLWKGPPVGATG